MSKWQKQNTIGCMAILFMMGIISSAGAISSDSARFERILVDLRQKDCQGRPNLSPEIVEATDFLVNARDASTLRDNPVPVNLLAYDEENGIAEIAFPLKNGYIYSIKTTF